MQARCSACHGVNMITGSTGYTQERWQDLISTMVKLPDAQAATVTQYLATHFPAEAGTGTGSRSGPDDGDVQGMGGADARPAIA